MEFRQEMSAFVKAYAINQFNKNFSKPDLSKASDQIFRNIKTIQDVYRPKRYFRRKNAPPEDNSTKIQITILEYGFRGISSGNKNVPSSKPDNQDLSSEIIEGPKDEEVYLEIYLCFLCFFISLFLFFCMVFVFLVTNRKINARPDYN